MKDILERETRHNNYPRKPFFISLAITQGLSLHDERTMQGANEKKTKLSCCNRNIPPLMQNNKSTITTEAQPPKK